MVATPIGNLGDITARALAVLGQVALLCAEDTRVTRRLLAAFGVRGGTLLPLHAHNEAEQTGRVLAALAAGQAVALVSDAGTPLISDPGERLVAATAGAGHDVVAVPGASALTAALSIAGLPATPFTFLGFLAERGRERKDALALAAALPTTLALYEAPHRLRRTLADLAEALGERPAALCREITKRFEEVERGTLAELVAAHETKEPRGEYVIVVGPPPAAARLVDDAAIDAALRPLLAEGATRAAAAVARQLGVPRRRVYARALALAATEEA